MNNTIRITIIVQPGTGFAAIEPGWTIKMNQRRPAVTVTQSNKAGITAALANPDFSFFATYAAPVMSAIDAINWFEAPKEPQITSQLPLAAR